MRQRAMSLLVGVGATVLAATILVGTSAHPALAGPAGCQLGTDPTDALLPASGDILAAWVDTTTTTEIRVDIVVRNLTNSAADIPAGQFQMNWQVSLDDIQQRQTLETGAAVYRPYLKATRNAAGTGYVLGYENSGALSGIEQPVNGSMTAGANGVISIWAGFSGMSITDSDVMTDAVAKSFSSGLSSVSYDTAPDTGRYGTQFRATLGNHTCIDQTLPAQPTAKRAADFVDSIGVNSHINFSPSNYTNYTGYESGLQYLGIRHVRDGLPNADQPVPVNEMVHIHNDLIPGFTASIYTRPQDATYPVATQITALGAYGSALDYIEGINEADNANASAQNVHDWQVALFNGARTSLPTKTILPYSLANRTMYASYAAPGSLQAYSDLGNMHTYAGGEPYTKTTYLETYVPRFSSQITGTNPVVMGETGYSTGLGNSDFPAVSQRAQAAYIPKTLFTNFSNSIVRTYLYEMADEATTIPGAQGFFGLLTSTFAPKPSGLAVHNLTTLLADPTPIASPGTLSQTYSDPLIKRLLLQKGDGSYWLALWQDAVLYAQHPAQADLFPPAKSVTVTLGAAKAGTIYNTGADTIADGSFTSRTSFTVSVPAEDVVLVKLV